MSRQRHDVELTHMPILRGALAVMAVWDHVQGRGADALTLLAFVAGITLVVGLVEMANEERLRKERRA